MNSELIISLLGFVTSVLSTSIAFLAFRKSDKETHKTDGKTEGVMFSDIGYIKACVDRVEKNLNKVDERDRNIIERLSKVEESLINVTKRVDDMREW